MKSTENVIPRPWGQGCLTWESLARQDISDIEAEFLAIAHPTTLGDRENAEPG
jgi:hypothetical protein